MTKISCKVRLIVIWSIIISITLFISLSRASVAKNSESVYYYSDKLFNKKCIFMPKEHEIMISFAPDITLERVQQVTENAKLKPIRASKDNLFGIYRLPVSAVSIDDTIAKIRTHSEVISAMPAMVNREGHDSYFTPHQLTVQFKQGLSEERMLEIIAACGCQVVTKHRTRGYYTLAIPKERMHAEISHGPHGKALFEIIREFISQPEVEFAEPNFWGLHPCTDPFDPNHPDDPLFSYQWNLAKIKASEAWDIERGDPNVIIAILDGGFDYTHEDLIGNLLPRNGEDWNFVNPESTAPYLASDPTVFGYKHGTWVAGVTSAVTDNGLGVSSLAHGCRFMPLKISEGWPFQIEDHIHASVDAINYVSEYAEKYPWLRFVMNCSWGTRGNDVIAIHAAILRATDHGIPVCVAGGNIDSDPNGDPNTWIDYPAKYPEVIAVGATDPDDSRSTVSRYGIELDVVAPGGEYIPTTEPAGLYSTDKFYETSSACPHVAGLAALLLSRYPHLGDLPINSLPIIA